MQAGWIITRDFIADTDAPEGTNANAVGIVGPSTYEGETDAEALPIRFFMYDDDGERYYGGRMNEAAMDAFGELDPLYAFGMPNAGATELRYKGPNDLTFRTL